MHGYKLPINCTRTRSDGRGMVRAQGPLLIDTFVRGNYSLDTNAMLVGFLPQIAEAERFLGNATGSDALLRVNHA